MNFKNVSAPFPTTDYADMLFSTSRPNSLTNYYRDMSRNLFSANGTVVGWYQAPENDTYYENGRQGWGEPFGELLQFALEKADAELDFGQFDNDGSDGLPNSGDDDGRVDTVFFIHPETGAECDRGPNIWSHSSSYSNSALGHHRPFISKDVRNGALRPDGTPDFIVIDDYTIQPGQACGSTASNRRMIQVGVFCHEYGHALGLPDLYDRTPRDPGPDSAGIGHWCLMAAGSYGGDNQHPECPAAMSAWCKYFLGWGQVTTLTDTDDIELDPVSTRNDIYRLVVPNTDEKEYFLLECRMRNATAGPGRHAWDQHLRAEGLAVWHVDERVGEQDPRWPFAEPNKGQNDSPVRVNPVRPPTFKSKRPLVALIQADKKLDLEENRFADANDLFQAGDIADDESGRAGTRGYDSTPTGIMIKGVALTPNHIKSRIVFDNPQPAGASPVPAAPPAPTLAGSEEQALVQLGNAVAEALVAEDDIAPGKISAKGLVAKLKKEQIQEFAKIDPVKLGYIVQTQKVKPLYAQGLYQLGVQARTQEITSQTETNTEAFSAAKNLLMKSKGADSAAVVLAPGHERIQQITGLKLEAVGSNVAEDAAKRLATDTDLKMALGLEGEFTLAPATGAFANQPTFCQLTQVGDEKLPVFGTDVRMFYNENKELVGVTAKKKEIPTTVTGGESVMSAEDAAKSAASAIGVPASLIHYSGKGVFVPATGSGMQTGRVAHELTIDRGKDRPTSTIYLDAETKKVLHISN